MHQERDASKVDEPAGEPPDKDLDLRPDDDRYGRGEHPAGVGRGPESEAPDEEALRRRSGLLGDPGVGRGDGEDDRAEQDLARCLGKRRAR